MQRNAEKKYSKNKSASDFTFVSKSIHDEIKLINEFQLSKNKRDNYKKLSALLEKKLYPLLAADDSGKFIYANKSASKLLSLPKKKLLEMYLWEFDFSKRKIINSWRSYIEDSATDFHFHLSDSAQNKIHVEVNHQSGFHLIGLNIDEKNLHQNEISKKLLLENKRKLDTLIENIPGIVYRCKNDKNWTMIFISEGCFNLTGYKPNDLLNNKKLSYSDIIHPEDRNYVSAEINKALKDNKAFQLEYRIISKQNEIYWVYEKGCSIKDSVTNKEYLEGIIIDITDRTIVEQNLVKSEERFSAFYNSSFSGIVIHNDGFIVDCNQGICDMLGFTWSELIGRNGRELIPESEQKKIVEMISNDSNAKYDSKIIRKDGSLIDVRVKAKNIDYMGRKLRASEYIDITIEKKIENIHNSRIRLLELSNNCTKEELLQETLNEVEKLTESRVAFYHFIGDDEKTVNLQAWSTNTLENMCKITDNRLHYNIDEAGVWIDAVRLRKPVIHNNYNDLPNKKGMPEGHAAITRELVVPVFRNRKIVAVLGVGNKKTNYDEKDKELLSTFADLAWDIAERKLNLDSIKENEETLRLALTAADQGLFDLNIQTGKANVSAEYLKMIGLDPSSYNETNTKWVERLHADDKERVYNAYIDYINGNIPEYKVEFRQKASNGEYKWILSMGKIIEWDKDNKPLRMIGTHTDISKIKSTEEKLRRLTKLHFEISQFAMEFVNVSMDNVNRTINKALESFGKLFNVDRVYIFDYLFEKGKMNNSYEWCAENISKEINKLQNVPIKLSDTLIGNHLNKKPVIINNVNEQVLESSFKDSLAAQGIKSLISQPMFIKDKLVGFVGFDSVKNFRTWEEEEINLLRILAQLFSNLLDRRKTQTALKASEENFRNLIENTPDGIVVIRDLKVIMANKSAAKIMGFNSSSDLLNRSPLDFVHKDSLEESKKVVLSFRNDNKYESVNIKIIKKDSSIITCEFQAVAYSAEAQRLVLVTFRDITDKITNELELEKYRNSLEKMVAERTQTIERQSQFFKVFINTIPNPAFVKDLDGKYTEVNKAFLDFFEVSRDKIIGKTLSSIAPKELVLRSLENERLILEKKSVVSYESHHILKDGSKRDLLVHKTAFNEPETKTLGITGLVFDITDQKKLLNQLISSYEKEKELNEIKTNFISMASHEFRTPLTTILASTELIDIHNKRGNYDKIDTHVNRIQESVSFMNSLLEEVLILSRTERGVISFAPIATNLKPLLIDIIEQCTVSAKPNHNITMNYLSGESRFIIDPKLVTLIINNLLNNGIKYSPKGGSLNLDVYYKEEYLIFIVNDEGIGISNKDIKRIFDPFFRASNVNDIAGHGLGLSIVKSAVELHKGTVSVESKINEGTKFQVKIKAEPII